MIRFRLIETLKKVIGRIVHYYIEIYLNSILSHFCVSIDWLLWFFSYEEILTYYDTMN